jgi:hypothetical protein
MNNSKKRKKEKKELILSDESVSERLQMKKKKEKKRKEQEQETRINGGLPAGLGGVRPRGISVLRSLWFSSSSPRASWSERGRVPTSPPPLTHSEPESEPRKAVVGREREVGINNDRFEMNEIHIYVWEMKMCEIRSNFWIE